MPHGQVSPDKYNNKQYKPVIFCYSHFIVILYLLVHLDNESKFISCATKNEWVKIKI